MDKIQPTSSLNYPLTTIDSWDAIEKASSEVPGKIVDLTRRYQTIDVAVTMQKLTQVGDLIRLSLAGADGFQCSVPIMEISTTFQTLITNSHLATCQFVEVTLQALKKHQLALLCIQKDKPEKALEMIGKTAEMAGQMEAISAKLVKEADKLSNLAKSALIKATDDKVVTVEERKKTEMLLADLEAQEKKLTEKTSQLQTQVSEEQEKERKLAEKATETRHRTFALSVASAFIPTLSKAIEETSKQAKDLSQQESETSKRRAELQKEMREANATLAESISKLSSTSIKKDELNTSISALEVTVQTLGKIRNIFENVRVFWSGVKDHCKNLANIENIRDSYEIDKEEFIDSIELSGLGWLALGKINRMAAISMGEVSKSVEKHMDDLPTSSNAALLIKQLSDDLLNQINSEDKYLEN